MLSPEERKALKACLQEAKQKVSTAAQLAAFIETFPEPDRSLALLWHELIATEAPHLKPRTWYGMPAYATAAGKVICFFQPASKFKTRYATLGFTEAAALDEGECWPVAFAITGTSPQVREQLRRLIRRACSRP